MTLHQARGRNSYCGPAALAILTGKTTDDAARVIRSITGRSRVYGVSAFSLVRAAAKMGLTMKHIVDMTAMPTLKRLTLQQAMSQLKADRVYVVNITGHYIVLRHDGKGWCGRGWLVHDNVHTAKPLEEYRGKRKRIKRIWEVVEQ